ncbi:MAG: hypothetical protein V3R64_03055, partial [Sphingomonadales bacterium]
VNAEDHGLIAGVEEGMASSSYTSGPLAAREICLIDAAEKMRAAIPVAALEKKPNSSKMAALIEEANCG